MKRKLIRQGRNALTLTLPSEWVKRNSLDAGDEVDVIGSEGPLVIGSKQSPISKTLELTLESNNPWYVGQIVRYGYLANYDQVILYFNSPDVLKEILKVCNYLLGFEATEQGTDYCILQNLAKESEKEYGNLQRKVFLLTISLFDSIINVLKEKQEFDEIELIKSTNNNILKFALFCRKVILKGGQSTKINNLNEYILLQRLTMISNNLVYLSKSVKDRKSTGNERLLYSLGWCKDIYQIFYGAFYSKDINSIIKLNENRKKFFGEFENEIVKSNATTNISLYYIAENIRLISSSGSLLLQIIQSEP